MTTMTVLAVNLGAESGRVMTVYFDGQQLALEELHRFPNTTVTINDTLLSNSHDCELAQGLDTPVSVDDQIAIFPPIVGG